MFASAPVATSVNPTVPTAALLRSSDVQSRHPGRRIPKRVKPTRRRENVACGHLATVHGHVENERALPPPQCHEFALDGKSPIAIRSIAPIPMPHAAMSMTHEHDDSMTRHEWTGVPTLVRTHTQEPSAAYARYGPTARANTAPLSRPSAALLCLLMLKSPLGRRHVIARSKPHRCDAEERVACRLSISASIRARSASSWSCALGLPETGAPALASVGWPAMLP